nr:PREDICTED: somatostatin-like [Latimeria chalumnae]|eukprot:XP_005999859.1 PREDICTED: somatostatin-like [Latimeria chalumnae]
MMCSHVQSLLAVLSASLLLVGVGGLPKGEVLTDLFQGQGAEGKEDFSRMLMLKMVSNLLKSENDVLVPSAEDTASQDELTRRLAPSRERKAGCKNFFWKTFTSC